jgi:hypothetical protein
MALYPKAIWRPLPENQTQSHILATQVILHTAVSGASSLFGYFARSDVVVESHFYVNLTGVEQYMDTDRRADANRLANVRAISIETWDGGAPERTPWTPTQMDLLVELVVWCCTTHNIPAQFCPAWDQPGIGWHVMFGAPGPWTPVQKSCPGAPRIAQMPELLGRVQAVLAGAPIKPPVPEEENEMLIISTSGQPPALLDGGRMVPFGDPDTLAKLSGAGAKHIAVSAEDYGRFLLGFAAADRD